MTTLRELHRQGTSELRELENPALEAKVILLETLDISEEKFFSEPDLEVSEKKKDDYFKKLEQRKKGMPIAYITGVKEFWSMDFRVGKGVLIPRPESEGLVEKVLELDSEKKGLIVDVGTGCGNLAVVLAKERPESKVVGLDISSQAVSCARGNARFHDASNVWFVVGDLLNPLKKSKMKKECRIIVSNPPYVDDREWKTLDPQIRDHEPRQALVSAQDGYAFIHRLIQQAPNYLRPGGNLVFEIGKGQENKVRKFFSKQWKKVTCFKDLAGIKRVFLAELSR